MTKYEGDKRTQRALAAYTNLVRASETVVTLLSRQLDSFGLTMAQFRALEALLHLGPMSQATLSEKLLCGQSSMALLIRRLEKRGLIVRRAHQRDQRSRVIHLTPEGQKKIATVFPRQAKLIRARMSALKKREQETLRRLCRKLGRGDPVRFLKELTKVDADDGE